MKRRRGKTPHELESNRRRHRASLRAQRRFIEKYPELYAYLLATEMQTAGIPHRIRFGHPAYNSVRERARRHARQRLRAIDETGYLEILIEEKEAEGLPTRNDRAKLTQLYSQPKDVHAA